MKPASAPPARVVSGFVIIAVLIATLSMRAPFLAVSPLLREISDALGLDAASASLLTSLPVVVFAVLTPPAALIVRRAGAEIAMLVFYLVVILGLCLRALPGFGWMLAGTVLIGAGITIANIVVPVVIRREVPSRHLAVVMAAYAAVINVGALLATVGTAPLAEWIGWNEALLAWLWAPVVGVALWVLHMWRQRLGRGVPGVAPERLVVGAGHDSASASGTAGGPDPAAAPPPRIDQPRRPFSRSPALWLLVATFCCQSAGYYAISTWLPTLVADTTGRSATSAGALASVFQALGVLGSFFAPFLVRFLPVRVVAAVVGGFWIILSAGLLIAPQAFVLWAVIGGIAQSSGFVVVMTVMMRLASNDREAATGSALVQGFGYFIGALGAPAMGLVHELSGGWVAPLFITLALATGYLVFLLASMSAQKAAA